jgi:hypothetical protein
MIAVQLALWPAPPVPDRVAEMRRVLRYSGYSSLAAWTARHQPRRLQADGTWRELTVDDLGGDVQREVGK